MKLLRFTARAEADRLWTILEWLQDVCPDLIEEAETRFGFEVDTCRFNDEHNED